MTLGTLLAIAVALAMDAFAVAAAAGIALKAVSGRQTFRLAFHFGLFQALMPIAGWAAGRSVRRFIEPYDHWAAFGLLALIGGHMVWSALHPEKGTARTDPTRGWTLVMLSVATSLDALAVGLSLSMLDVAIWWPAMVIGMVCAAFTTVGLHGGGFVGASSRLGRYAELAGGTILVAIGINVLFG